MNSTYFCLYLIFILTLTSNFQHIFANKTTKNKLPPCRVCKIFIESFKNAIKTTENGKFEGGDTAWEEEKLGSYATSEIRLVEIQEKICSDIEDGKDQCYSLFEQHDSDIENWWFNKQTTESDLYVHFCINTFKHCCPEHHYGQNCTPCMGFPDNICSNNGKCKGTGTRKGNGQCKCDKGYTGENCELCSNLYYEAYKDDKKLLCSKCHPSCKDSCNKSGPTGCTSCNEGWVMTKENGCLDLNECASPISHCNPLQFCVNTEGSYQCVDCDVACAGCTGNGPDMCKQCANGYILVDKVCIDKEQENRKQYVFLTRYLTYLGLCLATCIIFNKNVVLAAVIGIAVGIYIAVSEYILNTPAVPKTDNIAEQYLNSIK